MSKRVSCKEVHLLLLDYNSSRGFLLARTHTQHLYVSFSHWYLLWQCPWCWKRVDLVENLVKDMSLSREVKGVLLCCVGWHYSKADGTLVRDSTGTWCSLWVPHPHFAAAFTVNYNRKPTLRMKCQTPSISLLPQTRQKSSFQLCYCASVVIWDPSWANCPSIWSTCKKASSKCIEYSLSHKKSKEEISLYL